MAVKLDKFKALQALPVSTVILGADGKIVGVNESWKEFADKNGMCLPNFGIGANYLDHCGSATSRGIAKDLKELLSGRRDLVTTIYPCHSPKQQRWFFLIGLALATERRSGIAILHVDLTKFLPIPIGGRALRAKPSQAPTIAASGILEAIANTVETSVSDNLASQLNAMLGAAAPPTRKAQAKDGDCDQISRARLSKRQLEVLKLLGEGRTNAEIARTLFRSPNTIKLHVSAILHRLKLKSRTQAALLAATMPRAESDR